MQKISSRLVAPVVGWILLVASASAQSRGEPAAVSGTPATANGIAAPIAPPRVVEQPAEMLPETTNQLGAPVDLPQVGGGGPSIIAAGEAAFNRGCITCHDADKSLGKRKTVEQWFGIVDRMAKKDGADVPRGDIPAIVAYLTAATGGAVTDGPNTIVPPSFTFFGTLSPTYRGVNDNLQNPGFFPDVWLGAAWSNGSPLSAQATTCITCHDGGGVSSRFELVDAFLRLDLAQALGCTGAVKSSVTAGRFIVPFGAFAQQSNPGVYRTVSRPLIYNMGQRVYDGTLGDPVLPMPYSDEGATFNFNALMFADTSVNWDAYVINGLQGTADGIDFDASRDYVDNNRQPAAGTRLTVGSPFLKFGGSYMSGKQSPTGGVGAFNDSLAYNLYGYDAVFRYDDIVRIQFEYARRNSDRIIDNGLPFVTSDRVAGWYLEGEVLVWRPWGVSILGRYDRQDRVSLAPPPGSTLTVSNFGVQRYTGGLNFHLSGGSLFMINVERWILPEDLQAVNVYGARWAFSF